MALPVGTISMSQVNTELKNTATATISLNDARVRSLAGRPSGTISMSDLRGKSYTVPVNVIVFNANVGSNGKSFNVNYNVYNAYIQITVDSGNSRVYYDIDGGSSGSVKPNETKNVQMPQGYGRKVTLSPNQAGGVGVTVRLIGDVYP